MEVTGRGSVSVFAHGPADAEHRVEREIAAAWPGATVVVTRIERSGEQDRLVDEFRVGYTVRGVVDVPAGAEEASRAAFREARERLADSRHRRVEWVRAVARDDDERRVDPPSADIHSSDSK